MGTIVKAIEYYLPDNLLTNKELHSENPTWDMNIIEKRAGVKSRYISSPEETSLDLAYHACRKLIKNNKGKMIDGLIFCTETADHIIPPNSFILQKKLELPEKLVAFDFTHACSGFIYGLVLAKGLLCTGTAQNILLVNADTYSKYINKKDRSSRVLFGDGAAVSWICANDTSRGIIDVSFESYGIYYDRFMIPSGGCRMPVSEKTKIQIEDKSGNIRTLENIYMDGAEILKFTKTKVPVHIRNFLAKNSLNIEDIDHFVFHQASKMVLDALMRILKIPEDKFVMNYQEFGNTVSASIPIALKCLINSNKLHKGQKILMCGFGVGLSIGSVIIEW